MNRSDISGVKSFLSSTFDRFRLPYGKNVIEWPRDCVFAGTTNRGEYLRDETGARRFWPLQCGRIDIDALTRDRDQLWAEAVHHYHSGVIWWLESAESVRQAAQEQSDRYEHDPWHSQIADFIESRETVSVSQILEFCLDKNKAQWSQMDQNRVARSLRALKWQRYKQRLDSGFEWRYRRGEQ